MTSQSSVRIPGIAANASAATGIQASTGSIRRSPRRPGDDGRREERGHDDEPALTPAAFPGTRTSTSTPTASASSRMRRAVEGWSTWSASVSPAGVRTGAAAGGGRPGRRRAGTPVVLRGTAWHDLRVTDQEARYDRIAEGYAAWWSPVHRPGTLGLLDEVEADVAAGAAAPARRRLRDRGDGRGRGPSLARTSSVDGGRRVGGHARDRGARGGALAGRGAAPAPASRRRSPTGCRSTTATFDLALSAFVLQLVPSRYRALREMRRVLRPGGTARLRDVAPRRRAVRGRTTPTTTRGEAVGLEPRWDDDDDVDDDATIPGNDDVPSPEAAVAQLRRAGFAGARPARPCSSTRSRPRATWGSSPGSTTRTSSRAMDRATSATALEHRVLERLRAPARRVSS